mmetsp:Transcript_20057/g.45686  ORF Transcript_20057/g.45686 Transcript_20057/m.45686 type:complete len:418 (-) Transcript_20057:151-1404(-)
MQLLVFLRRNLGLLLLVVGRFLGSVVAVVVADVTTGCGACWCSFVVRRFRAATAGGAPFLLVVLFVVFLRVVGRFRAVLVVVRRSALPLVHEKILRQRHRGDPKVVQRVAPEGLVAPGILFQGKPPPGKIGGRPEGVRLEGVAEKGVVVQYAVVGIVGLGPEPFHRLFDVRLDVLRFGADAVEFTVDPPAVEVGLGVYALGQLDVAGQDLAGELLEIVRRTDGHDGPVHVKDDVAGFLYPFVPESLELGPPGLGDESLEGLGGKFFYQDRPAVVFSPGGGFGGCRCPCPCRFRFVFCFRRYRRRRRRLDEIPSVGKGKEMEIVSVSVRKEARLFFPEVDDAVELLRRASVLRGDETNVDGCRRVGLQRLGDRRQEGFPGRGQPVGVDRRVDREAPQDKEGPTKIPVAPVAHEIGTDP